MKRINGYGQVFRIFNQGVFSVLLFVVFSLMFLPPVGLPGARVPLLLWAAQETSLEPGKPIERELSLRQSHEYQLSLLSGQFLRLTIEPQAADVALELKNPAGQKVLDANLTGVGGQERLSYLSPADGTYRLKVVSLSGGKTVGTYRLNLTLRQQASAQEQNLIAAERLLTEAGAMAETPATSAQAIQKAEQALAFWREVGDPYWEAYSLNLLAAAWSAQAKHETALALAEEAMALARRQKDRVNEAQALYYSGNAQRLLSRTQPARDSFAQALAISRQIGDRRGESADLSSLGSRYAEMGVPCTDAVGVFDIMSPDWSSSDLNLRFYMYTPGSAQDPTWPLDRYMDPTRPNRGFTSLKPGRPDLVIFSAIAGVPINLPTRMNGSMTEVGSGKIPFAA